LGNEDTMKKSVILRAPCMTQSGYGVHSRQIARWLFDRNDVNITCNPVPWGITPWILDRSRCDGLLGKIMDTSMEPPPGTDLSIQVQLPNEWDPRLSKFNVGVTAGVETNICHPHWIEAINRMDRVIVPTNHVKETFMSSGKVSTPIEVVPESYIDAIDDDDIPALELPIETSFNFLLVGQITATASEADRKNTFYAIKWLCEIFGNDPDVGIIIKTNSGRSTKIDRQITTDLMRNLLGEVRSGPYPRFHLLHGDMTEKEMAALYKIPSIKCLVALTRGEGFGLPILEAAAAGIPVIATNWSGHLDYLSLGKFIPVKYTLENIHKSLVSDNIFIDNAKWASPSEHDAKNKLKKFRMKSTIPNGWAQDLKMKLRETHSFNAIAKAYDEKIGNIFL